MSALIKADAAAFAVRPFHEARNGDQSRGEVPSAAPEDARLEALEQENRKLRKAASDALDAARQAEARGHEKGLREAEEQARREDDRRLEAIRAGLDGALDQWRDRLAALEKLAPLIAHSALAKLFDEHSDYAELVTRAVALQLERLRRETIVGIQLSADDFPDEDSLAALRARAGTGEVALVRDPSLGAGECRMDLRLGHVDLGVQAQWAQLSSLLRETWEEEAA